MTILLTVMALMIVFILGHMHGAWYERFFGREVAQKIMDQEVAEYYAGANVCCDVMLDDEIDNESMSERIKRYAQI